MMTLEQRARVMEVLVTHLASDQRAREFAVRDALYGLPVLNQIEWDKSQDTFISHLVEVLLRYGFADTASGERSHTLCMLLRGVGDKRGVDVREKFEQLAQELDAVFAESIDSASLRKQNYLIVKDTVTVSVIFTTTSSDHVQKARKLIAKITQEGATSVKFSTD